jgi:hypothetical protein
LLLALIICLCKKQSEQFWDNPDTCPVMIRGLCWQFGTKQELAVMKTCNLFTSVLFWLCENYVSDENTNDCKQSVSKTKQKAFQISDFFNCVLDWIYLIIVLPDMYSVLYCWQGSISIVISILGMGIYWWWWFSFSVNIIIISLFSILLFGTRA